jgi:formate hydrogenlyase transcriptional activator
MRAAIFLRGGPRLQFSKNFLFEACSTLGEMAIRRITDFAARPGWGAILRYGLAIVSVAAALEATLMLRRQHGPHPFITLSLAAIGISFWYAGAGPGVVALLLSCFVMARLVMRNLLTPGVSVESYLVFSTIFGLIVAWISASRRRAERLLREARDNLEVRVTERTAELTQANIELQAALELNQNTEAELRREKDRLKLLLDLNNSIVSNLELRELLRAISASVRRVMHCDAVGVNVPDPETGELKLHALDFPKAKGSLREGMVRPPDSLAGKVFSTGEPTTFTVRDLPGLSRDADLYRSEGLNSVCLLPITSRDRRLGVLGLSRVDNRPISPDDVRFLMQVANQVAIAVENALAYGQIAELKDKLAQEKLYLEDEIRTESNFEEIVGKSAALVRVLKQVETVAPTDSTVLIYGETGTGKELIARAIHNLSPRQGKTFVKLNCAAIPTGLLESELFGHEKGAFTGAIAQRIGRLELANHGTLFLDEIGDIPLELQPKLLRVLQEREFERLGNTRTFRTDVRLIAATNRDLAAMVEEQKFRSDLFFRLNVFPIQVPSLRERAEDIPLLVRHFVADFSRRMNRSVETIPSETMKALCHYSWPGNIRELQNVIERAVILSAGPALNVPLGELQPHATQVPASENGAVKPPKRLPVHSILTDVDRDQIIRALKETHGRVGGPNGAAALLGLKRTTFITRMKKLGIDPNRLPEVDRTAPEVGDRSGPLIQ